MMFSFPVVGSQFPLTLLNAGDGLRASIESVRSQQFQFRFHSRNLKALEPRYIYGKAVLRDSQSVISTSTKRQPST